MLSFQGISNSEDSLVSYSGIIEVNEVIITTSVSCNIWASFTFFYISNEFFFPRWKTPSGLANVAPRVIGARTFIHHIALKFKRRPKLGGREFLLQDLVRSCNYANFIRFRRRRVRGSVIQRVLYEYEKQNAAKKKARNKLRQSKVPFHSVTGLLLPIMMFNQVFLLVLSRAVEVFDCALHRRHLPWSVEDVAT